MHQSSHCSPAGSETSERGVPQRLGSVYRTCQGYAVNMSTSVVSFRLDSTLKERLDALSATTGRPAAYYVREAVMEHLDQLEYAYELRGEAEAIRRGEIQTVPSADLAAELGS